MTQSTQPAHAIHDEWTVLAARFYAVGLSLQQASAAIGAGDYRAAYDRAALASVTVSAGAVQLKQIVEHVDAEATAGVAKLRGVR